MATFLSTDVLAAVALLLMVAAFVAFMPRFHSGRAKPTLPDTGAGSAAYASTMASPTPEASPGPSPAPTLQAVADLGLQPSSRAAAAASARPHGSTRPTVPPGPASTAPPPPALPSTPPVHIPGPSPTPAPTVPIPCLINCK